MSWGKYPISVCAIQGRRDYMEDEILSSNNCIAVFDGHGGNAVAQYIRSNLNTQLQAARAASEGSNESSWDSAKILRSALLKVDEEVLKVKDWDVQGSTAVVVWMPTDDALVIANIGDSRAVLSRDQVSIDLTVDHKPNVPKERARIEAAGGIVKSYNGLYRVNGIMALSRAIGDGSERPILIADPDVEVWQIQETDEFVVVAIDGLWEVLTSQDVVTIVHTLLRNGGESYDRDSIPALLAERALRHGSSDNIAIIILWLNESAPWWSRTNI